jgi:hypothetical protein
MVDLNLIQGMLEGLAPANALQVGSLIVSIVFVLLKLIGSSRRSRMERV